MKPWRTGIALVLMACAPPVLAAEPVGSGYVLPETEVFDTKSAEGQVYRIFISKPLGKAPDGGFPVLYVLDGNAMFAGFAEARRIHGMDAGKLDQMIVVGVGYPTDKIYDDRRMLDFTGPIQTPALKALYKAYPAGGRDKFLSFLLDDLRPEIARRYGAHPVRQSLFGHSLGGLFALHALYSCPGAFHSIIAASPSIWWDNQAIVGDEPGFRTRIEKDPALGRASRLLMLAGEREEARVTVADSMALAKRLEPLSAFGLRSEFRILDGESHISVPSRAVTVTLRAAMQWP